MFASTFTRAIVSTAGAAVFAAICLTAAVAPAAANPYVTVSKSVRYAGLDLNTAKGRAVLDARIRAAAKSICNSNSKDLRNRLAESRCVRNAIAQATRS